MKTVHVSEESWRRLKAMALQDGVTLSALLDDVIRKHLTVVESVTRPLRSVAAKPVADLKYEPEL